MSKPEQSFCRSTYEAFFFISIMYPPESKTTHSVKQIESETCLAGLGRIRSVAAGALYLRETKRDGATILGSVTPYSHYI